MSDAPRCIFCGAEYEYDYHTFAHLGGFRCPKCGYSRTEPDVAVVEVDSLEPDSSLAELRVDGEFLPAAVSLPAAYNLYNAAAAVAAATALGINAKAAVRSQMCIRDSFQTPALIWSCIASQTCSEAETFLIFMSSSTGRPLLSVSFRPRGAFY